MNKNVGLHLNYDYSPWERKKSTPANRKHNHVKERTSVTITQREACSKSPESSECARKIFLKIQLKDKKDSLQKSKGRYLQLIEENKMLKENLIQMEENSYRNVTSILRKYKQYSGAYEALQSDVTTKRLEEKEREFEQISQTKQEEIKSLKKEAEQVQELIEMIRDELTRVNIYKSKDCGDQHQEVQLLNKDIYFMEEDFADELHHLSQTAHLATLAYTKQCACDQGNVKSNIAQEVLDNVDEQVKRMYQWNVHMQKEIGLHSEHAVALEKNIDRLKAEIRQLKYLEAKRRSQAKYPHTSQAKCEPDDDVVLNVAQQRVMPF